MASSVCYLSGFVEPYQQNGEWFCFLCSCFHTIISLTHFWEYIWGCAWYLHKLVTQLVLKWTQRSIIQTIQYAAVWCILKKPLVWFCRVLRVIHLWRYVYSMVIMQKIDCSMENTHIHVSLKIWRLCNHLYFIRSCRPLYLQEQGDMHMYLLNLTYTNPTFTWIWPAYVLDAVTIWLSTGPSTRTVVAYAGSQHASKRTIANDSFIWYMTP